jgi:PhnB protein
MTTAVLQSCDLYKLVFPVILTNTMKILQPYLNFDGNTKEAMEFYQSVLGGKLTMQTYADFGAPVEESEKDRIMHAMLDNDTLTFMAADGNKEHPVHMGDNISLSISGDDEEAISKYFEELSEGGKVTQPLEKAPWGDTFGMLTDKFGVNWLFNISAKKE